CFGVVDPRSLLHGQHSLRQVQSLCCIDRLNSQPVAVAQFQFAGVGFRAVVADCGQIPLPTEKPETLALKPIICRGEMPGLH
ncbi:hypothetical protein, partial [Delftia lacustris]|uniref:hypothetical protein n=1 Tax=Delftia lacustris TaxID=558537 RepID=UPI001ABFA811